jgi:hypothetical protein
MDAKPQVLLLIAALGLIAAQGAGDSELQSHACVDNLKQIGLSARIWASNHDDKFPPDFLSMKKELASPALLYCPADTKRRKAVSADWSKVTSTNMSYQVVTPNLKDSRPNIIYVKCPLHGHAGMSDGSGLQLKSLPGLEVKDGNRVEAKQ